MDSIIVLIKLILPGSIKPWVSREKATYYNSVIRIEGITRSIPNKVVESSALLFTTAGHPCLFFYILLADEEIV